MTNKNDNIHKDHRKRMKSRYLSAGGDSFQSHELLEMLLFYGVPRKDTNDLAHTLIERFGSLEGVFSAPVEELETVPGVKENVAVLLKLIREFERRCALEKQVEVKRYSSIDQIGEYLVKLFTAETVEKVYALLFDNVMRMIDCVFVNEGTVCSSQADFRKIAERALISHASSVVLAHNHPVGMAIPSGHDLDVTRNLDASLSLLGITLAEHVIVAGNKFAPILHLQ